MKIRRIVFFLQENIKLTLLMRIKIQYQKNQVQKENQNL